MRNDLPATFFHLEGVDISTQACQGTACFVARHRDPERWARADGEPRVYCLGRCHAAPAVATDRTEPEVIVDAPTAVLLSRVVTGGAPRLDAYRAAGGYAAIEQAARLGPAGLLDEVEASGLRGRGGAGFPTARKWRTAAAAGSDVKYVVANADEGDAGAYSDRLLLERDPHAVLEGLAIAARAIGAGRGVIYLRREYPDALQTVEAAIAEAGGAGALGPDFVVEVVRGEGSYVCGEETALLNAVEGRRPEVRARPPFPAERGLFGRPTVVNNVETLAALPWIITHGGASYASMGTPTSPGTKLLSLNSLFRRPGLYEVELGLPVRDVVDRLGGGLTDGPLRGLLIGGPLAGILPPALLDTPLDFEAFRAVGCEVGHGGVVAFDDHTPAVELVQHVFRFAAYESCGKCTPCRLGAARVASLLAAPANGWLAETQSIVAALEASSLCGHGTGLAAFARSVLTHYGEELRR
jgi:NADH:ubiquinone oxidoreductase subunit F (NADH-binding)